MAGGKGKGCGQSPIDKDTGRPMECHNCGSTTLLVGRCPRKGKAKGKGGSGRTRRLIIQLQLERDDSYSAYNRYERGFTTLEKPTVTITDLEE